MPGLRRTDNPRMTQLVLLPGLACDDRMWQHQLAVLPAAWQPTVTDVHARHDSIPAMAEALLARHPGPLVLCGASMGGIVAMEASDIGETNPLSAVNSFQEGDFATANRACAVEKDFDVEIRVHSQSSVTNKSFKTFIGYTG